MAPQALTLLLAAGPLLAAEGGQTPPPVPNPVEEPREVDTVTSLAAEARSVDRTSTPGRVKVYDSNDIIASGARTLGEFLGYVIPGQAQSSGQPGMISNPYQGGARPQDTQVLLDGLPLADATAIGLDLNKIPLAGIDRIEVLEGALSSRFGSHAMGGVVALYSAGTTGAGSHGELATGGGGDGRRAGVLPAFGWEGGWFRVGSVYYEDKPSTETNNAFRQGSVFGGFGQKLTEALGLNFTYRNFYQVVPNPFAVATPLQRVYDPDRRSELHGNQGVLGLTMKLAPGLDGDLHVGLLDMRRVEPNDDAVDGRDHFETQRLQFGAGLHWSPAPRWGLSFGLEAQEEKATLPGLLTGEDRGRGRSWALGLEARFDLTPTFRLVGDLRQESVRQRFSGADGRTVEGNTDSQFTFRMGANQKLPWGFRLYAGGGTGFNSPLLVQTVENARGGYGSLQNERSQFAQVGLGWEMGRLAFRLEASRTRYDHLIYAQTSDLPGAKAPAGGDPSLPGCNGSGDTVTLLGYANGQAFRVQGLEANLGYRTAWRLPVGFDAFVRNQEARDLNVPAGQEFSTTAVQNRPFTVHGLRTYVAGVKVRVETRWNRVGRRYESVHTFACSDLAPLVTPTYVTYDDLSVTTTYTYSRFFQVILRGEHLAQKNISITDWQGRKTDLQNNAALVYGIPAPKPTATLEMRFRY